MDDSDKMIWYISKIYLYLFISLFIFGVLGLFIGIVADTYERIKVSQIFFWIHGYWTKLIKM